METIRSYIENLFATLPQTQEIQNLKEELLQNMEDKYYEEKNNGRSENEAIGIVISEFGNIDELLDEMGIARPSAADKRPEKNLRELNNTEIEEIISNIRFYGKMIAMGIMLCIFSPNIIIVYEYLFPKESNSVANALFISFVAFAVFILIIFGIKMSQYKFIEEGNFFVPEKKKSELESLHKELSQKNAFSIAFSVLLIFLGVIAVLLIENTNYEELMPLPLMIFIGLAVFNIIRTTYGIKPIEILLKKGQASEDPKINRKISMVLGAVAGLVFPLSTAIYLLLSFLTQRWDITWIIFPVVAICYGAFSSFYVMMKKKDA